ncbi:YHS domain-containing protein [Synechococcus sp. ATX 2A4]|nr:YHS domain-containing protein [Synechococcus sp. ATX 2A4]
MAKDPICEMVVPKATALSLERNGRSYYFCSQSCLQTFRNPDRELRVMRRRGGFVIGGVLALAMLRAGAFIALAAGVSLMSSVPLPALPWMSWGMWLFVLATPVQFIGGWSFYAGAWAALKRRALNMDVRIALGTSVAYFYSVVVVFVPTWLPVGVNERDVYFDVSAVVIAFVLMGKFMEEMIKQRSSAAVRKLLDLQPATAIGLSRATMRKIRQNLFWAFFYNIIGIPIAAFGWLNPMIAGAAMALNSLSVIVSSSLLRGFRAAPAI